MTTDNPTTTICSSCNHCIIDTDGRYSFCLDCPNFDIERIDQKVDGFSSSNDKENIKAFISAFLEEYYTLRKEKERLARELAESYFRDEA